MDTLGNYRFFYTPSIFGEENFIVCNGLGYESNPNFSVDRESFDNYLMMYVLSGELYVEQFAVKYTIKVNSGIIMDLRQKHKYYFDKSNGGKIVWFHFRGMPCQGIMEHLKLGDKLPFIFSSNTVLSSMESIFQATINFDNSTEFIISTKVYSLLCELLKDSLSEILGGSDKNDPFITLVRSYIKANIGSKITLDDLSSYTSISKYHFSHKFNRKFGMSLSDYIIQSKISLAKQFLLCTNDSISQIAQALNFTDQSYFTNTFKRATAVTPREYRKGKR